MSHAASTYVKHLRTAPNGKALTPALKAVLGQLADDHNEQYGFAWPSVGHLAQRACMTDRHCRRLLRDLEDMGILESTPWLRDNGGRSSSRYRFIQIDQPFDRKIVAETAKRMKLQAALSSQRPLQMRLATEAPSDTDVRGGRTTESGGLGHASPRGADTDVRGARTPLSPQEPLLNLSSQSPAEPPLEPLEPTLPAQGRVNVDELDRDRWNQLILMLKSELYSIPNNVALAKRFTVIAPSPGFTPQSVDNDFDVCFRAWWLKSVKRLPNGLLLVTTAEDEAATEAGIVKYRDRLVRLARRYFQTGPEKPVTFNLLREAGAPGLPKVDPGGAQWARVKAEIEVRIGQMPHAQRVDAAANFRSAIKQTQLLSVEMEGTAPVWRIYSPNAKKTRAVLALLRKQIAPSLQLIAGREVQLIVTEEVSP